MKNRAKPVAIIAISLVLTGCGMPPFVPTLAPYTAAPTPSVSPATPEPTATAQIAPDRPTYDPVDVKPDGFTKALSDDMSGYLGQELKWAKCGSFQCADIVVPLDYDAPGEQGITLSMTKKSATKKPKIGTLFINPGGPGGSGKEYVDGFDTGGLEQFDILGWDPRGVGDSTPVVCMDGKKVDAYNALDFSPEDEAERQALIDATLAYGKSCWEMNGILLEHISTVETVKDLDLLRQLVGDEKLYYYGASYGTEIGATYAELFGPNAARMVLDAAVDISLDKENAPIQAEGFDTALNHFAEWCGGKSSCSLGKSKDAVLKTITDFLDRLDSKPIAVGDRELTQTLATLGIGTTLYMGEDGWDYLDTAVTLALSGNGEFLLYLGDYLNGRDEQGDYGSLLYGFNAISCLDYSDEGLAEADRFWERDQQRAPIFGYYFGPGYLCPLWPVRPVPELYITGPGAPPIVVIGGIGDNATPYAQAVNMAQQLESGVLLTYEGEGHGAYGGNSTCIDNAVVKYLVKGTVPKDGTSCS
ncbi:MAG: alpha/beta hydrolase [Propionibacteriaceae bacterium]|nr:alpha/beta hydrolase [Propionibacteriaceae bacterium]